MRDLSKPYDEPYRAPGEPRFNQYGGTQVYCEIYRIGRHKRRITVHLSMSEFNPRDGVTERHYNNRVTLYDAWPLERQMVSVFRCYHEMFRTAQSVQIIRERLG